MAPNKFPTRLLVATLGCTLPALVGVSAPAVAFDFGLSGRLGPASTPPSVPQLNLSNSSFSGTFSTPDNEPVSTYTGRIPAFNIGLIGINQGPSPDFRSSGLERAVNTGDRQLSFVSRYSNLGLIFSRYSATPAGLSFSSGSFASVLGTGSYPVASATITPVPASAPIGGVLFLPGLAFWLLRKKI